MPLDIRPDHLKIVEEILEKHLPDREVWAFGSRVNGTAKETSDLDLVVIGENPLDFQTLGVLRDDFSESNLPYKVDVVDWAKIGETFREIIRKDKVVIKKRISNGQEIEGSVDNWQELPFSQAVLLNPRTHLVRGKVYPFVDMAAVNSDSHCVYSAEYRLFRGNGSKFVAGDTLMARITPCLENGKIARFCAEHGVVAHGSTEFIVIRGREDFTENDYAYYLIKWENVRSYAISQMTGTSGRQRVQTKVFDHLFVTIPPLPEQHAIAHILGTLDDKIELNRRMNETLEAMAQALFKSWFVDFDPVRAKMEGRPTGLPKEIEDLFPDSFEDSELGEIPRGWKYLPFGQLLEDTIGGDWGKEYPEGDFVQPISIIRGTDFSDISSGFIGKVPTRFTTTKKLVPRMLKHGDIIVEVSGGSPTQPTGRSVYISSSILKRFEHPVVCASFCRRFRPINANLGILAAFHLTNLYHEGGTWEYQNQSTGIANFQTNHFLEVEKVLVPSEKALSTFVHFVEPLIPKTATNETLNLSNLRDTLLPKLLSGEIRVTHLEKILERTL